MSINSVPRHDKKETNQLSPVKKRVKENSPPHQQRYNRAHISPQYHQSSNHINYYTNNGTNTNNANNINSHGHQLQHHQSTSSSQLITQPHTSYSNTNNNSMPLSHSSSHNSLKQQQVVSVIAKEKIKFFILFCQIVSVLILITISCLNYSINNHNNSSSTNSTNNTSNNSNKPLQFTIPHLPPQW